MAAPIPGVWGIDIGQCALKAVRLELVDGQIKATAFDYIEHPKILSQPDADPDQLTREALEQFLSRNTLRYDMVVIAVPGQSGLARFVKLPPVEEKKIADIVKFEAKQQIPFPLEEVVWDFQKLGSGEVTDGFALETEIGLFAMKRDMVFRYLQHFKDVGVEVHTVQMAPLGLVNYVSYDLLGKGVPGTPGPEGAEGGEDGKRSCIVALDIGTDSSNLVITDGEKIIWQRPIPLGGNHFTRALTKDLKLTFAKAEHLKRNAVKSPDLKKILTALKPVLNDFVGEVQRSLGYFTNTHRDAQIAYMIGLGNAFRLPGLQKFLQEKLQLEVKKLTKLERLSGDEVVNAPTFVENLPSFPVAYGLALQGLNQTRLSTNLLPYEIRVERLVRAKKPWAVAAAACLLLAAAGLTFGRNLENQAVKNPEIETAKKKASAVIEEVNRYNNSWADANRRFQESQAAIKRIAAGVDERFNWQLLTQYINMALPLPDGTKVSELTRQKVQAKRDYVTEDSKKAYQMMVSRRFAKSTGAPPDPLKAAQDEEYIRKHLVQINIEGINALYSEDLSGYFIKIFKDNQLLRGLSPQEFARVTAHPEQQRELRDQLPKSGWVVEIRGYTYHDKRGQFVIDTFLENLADLEKIKDEKGELIKLSQEMKDRVRQKVGYMFLYLNEKVENPAQGVFGFINRSYLRTLVRGAAPAAPGTPPGQPPPEDGQPEVALPAAALTREGWNPLGEIAGPVLGGGSASPGASAPPSAPTPTSTRGPTVARQPRQEFVLLFIWQEILPAGGL